MNIQEDFISFETAKLLKEKGFDIPCDYAYNNKAGYFEVDRSNFDEVYCFRPSLAMAMKWLREVHSIHIVMAIENNGNYIGYLYHTTGANIQGWDRRLSKISYEEACEAAIKYCLENLL